MRAPSRLQRPAGRLSGGTDSWWNQSVHREFHDTGAPLDPPVGTSPLSSNVRL